MALIEKLNAIGDAIRAKNGEEGKYTLDDMVLAIGAIETGGGGEEYFTDADLTFAGDMSYLFSSNKWHSVLEREKSRLKFQNPSSMVNMFANCNDEDLSYITIEGNGKTNCAVQNMFYGCANLIKLPKIRNVLVNANQSMAFSSMYRFNNNNDLIDFFDNNSFTNVTLQSFPIGNSMYSLRNIDDVLPYLKKALTDYKQDMSYTNLSNSWYALDEMNNIPIIGEKAKTYNGFGSTFSSSARVKNITFETNDGVAIPVQWKSQTIDLSNNDGVGALHQYTTTGYLLNYNSGITEAKKVVDDATYQALKNDPDWWTQDFAYSRYNHDSAVRTINSLPDTSAYLASAGGTNTIKFKGAAGSKTDGGAINTLTEAEIAVAAAKGWTVSLV